MPRHVDAWMDGVALSTVGPILIRQVHEDPPVLEIQNGDRPGGYGQRVLSKKRQSLKLAIECQIRELFDLAARSRAVEALARWTQGSVLELSNHPDRRLLCYCSGEPALGEVRDYTASVRLEFTADAVPFWEDKLQTALAMSGSAGTGTLLVPGTAETPVCISVKPTGAALTSFSATVGGQTISLSSLSVAKNSMMYFERDLRDDLAIRSGTSSLLSKRSAASADDLFVKPGGASVSFTANTACDVTFSVRGRWA